MAFMPLSFFIASASPEACAAAVMSSFIQRLPSRPSAIGESFGTSMNMTLFDMIMRMDSLPAPRVGAPFTVMSMTCGFQPWVPVISMVPPAPADAGIDMVMRILADLAAEVFLYAAVSASAADPPATGRSGCADAPGAAALPPPSFPPFSHAVAPPTSSTAASAAPMVFLRYADTRIPTP